MPVSPKVLLSNCRAADIADVLFKHKVVRGFSLTRWFRTTSVKEQQAFCAEIMSLLEARVLVLPAGRSGSTSVYLLSIGTLTRAAVVFRSRVSSAESCPSLQGIVDTARRIQDLASRLNLA